MTGIINLYKEKGMSSHSCVAGVRKILNLKKAGHPGTLDPEATGVLPIMVGGATRCSDLFLDMKKSYRGTATFGLTSDTQDIWGSVKRTEASLEGLTESSVREALSPFRGRIFQVPPAYSALKKDGVPYYKLARRGETVEAEARPVNVYSCELVRFSTGPEGLPEAVLDITCGRGTYIRTIISDLGASLGCGAVMSALERTSYGAFRSHDAVTLGELEKAAKEGRLDEAVRPLEQVFGFPRLELTKREYEAYMQGKRIVADLGRTFFPEKGEIYSGEEETCPEKKGFRIMLLLSGRAFALCRAELFDENKLELRADRYFGNE